MRSSDGLAVYAKIFRPTASARRWVTNHGGVGSSVRSPSPSERGKGANGARTTLFCGLSNKYALWTMPIPLPTASIVLPGNAPQLAVGNEKPTPGHVLTVTQP